MSKKVTFDDFLTAKIAEAYPKGETVNAGDAKAEYDKLHGEKEEVKEDAPKKATKSKE